MELYKDPKYDAYVCYVNNRYIYFNIDISTFTLCQTHDLIPINIDEIPTDIKMEILKNI